LASPPSADVAGAFDRGRPSDRKVGLMKTPVARSHGCVGVVANMYGLVPLPHTASLARQPMHLARLELVRLYPFIPESKSSRPSPLGATWAPTYTRSVAGKAKLKKGETLGRWTLVKFIRSGGNGDVWFVEADGEEAALKALHKPGSTDYARFQREVRT